MLKPVDLTIETPYRLQRPTLKGAEAWMQSRLGPDNMLAREAFTPSDLRDFIEHTSLFDLILEDGKVTDFFARVLAGHVAADLQEMTGKRGRGNMPPELFNRWLTIGQEAYRLRKPFCARASVIGRQNKKTENLVIPVTKGGIFSEVLVISEYWYEKI